MKFNFLSLGLILALALIPTLQVQSQEYTLSISSTSAIPGEVIEIPISIEAASKSIGSANLAISAAGALDITSVLPGSAIDTSAADFMDFDLNPVGMPVDMNGVLIGIIVDTANPLAAPGPYELAKLQISVSAFAKPTLVGEISFSDTLSGSLGASPNLVVEGSLPSGEFSGTDLMYQSGSVTVNTPPVTNLLVDITDVCNCSASASWTNGFTYNVIEVWVDSGLAATYQDLDEDGFVDNTSPPEPMPTSFDLGTTSTQIEVIAISNNEAAAAVLATVPGCTPNPDDDNDGCPDCSSGEYDPNNDGIDTDSDGLCDSGDPDLDGDGIPNDCDVDQTSGADCDLDGQDDTCQFDTDMDGTIDPCDNCPNDIAKTEPGDCGCGVVEDDDCDDDTIPNACDVDFTSGTDCDLDGQDDTCQIDTDMDGTIDPCDNCPNDNSKTEPGDCGCGVVEDDDCDDDTIPNACDADFTGGSDCDLNGEDDTCQIDTDMDGTIDPCDNCPNDNAKTEPGDCGCGIVEDDDCDDDTIPNACDVDFTGGADCDLDGQDDTCQLDTDMDGTIDPCDNCPNDNAKTEPGTCGCGVIEDDDCDDDGIPNACDIDLTGGTDCDTNGEDDTCQIDTDMDGTIDPCDNCPNDNAKTEPGDCGCGVVEDDDCDDDTIPNACDADFTGGSDCDLNGEDDTCQIDTDMDGTIDPCDNCPNDNAKTEPGDCGCGVVEDDDCDDDTIPNACDVDFTGGTDCDSNGEDDTCQLDTDMDGTIDPCDNCPNDNAKTEPGTCGCGVIEDDDCDDDGIPNACDIDLTGGADCDTNGEDDTCQIDTDTDGTIDPCDDDLDGDGIPNNCDVDQTAGTDSNGNGEDDICEVAFRRGDSNSNGAINVADPYWILLYLFSTDVSELPCYDAADIDDNGIIEMIDAVSLFQMLYGTGGVPADPFATCGVDPTTADALDCVTPSNACQ